MSDRSLRSKFVALTSCTTLRNLVSGTNSVFFSKISLSYIFETANRFGCKNSQLLARTAHLTKNLAVNSQGDLRFEIELST
jgi:hypothetical protein